MAPVTSLITLALVLPSTLALPFEFAWFKSKQFEQPPWHFEHPHRQGAYPTYTLTNSYDGPFPTAPTAPVPTAYTYVPSLTTGTGTTAAGTGTAVYPTGTSYAKRSENEKRQLDFPPIFPSGVEPTFSVLALPPTGSAYPWPMGYPALQSATGYPFPTGSGFPFPTGFSEPGMDLRREKRFEGPRRYFDHHRHYPYRPMPMPEGGMETMPSFTAPTAYPTGTAPSGAMPTAWAWPTGAY